VIMVHGYVRMTGLLLLRPRQNVTAESYEATAVDYLVAVSCRFALQTSLSGRYLVGSLDAKSRHWLAFSFWHFICSINEPSDLMRTA
jgi:hypothetical protein